MPVRSHYTKDSHMNKPLHSKVSARREPEPVYEDNAPCEACKNCEYKQMVEAAMEEEEREQQQPVGYKIQPLKGRATRQVPQEREEYREQEEKKPSGLFKRFGNYIAKNQAANKAAGETSLFDDMQKWGGGIMSGAGKLGQEEIDGLDRRKAATAQRDPRKDDELVDFLSGKKTRK